MKTSTFVLVAIVIAVDARKVCVPVPHPDPCVPVILAAAPIWKEAAQMLASLNTDCSNELSAVSFADEEEFDAFSREFYMTNNCTTSHLSYQEDFIASLANIIGANYDNYYKFICQNSDRVGDAVCLAEGDESLLNAFTNVAGGWDNIIQAKRVISLSNKIIIRHVS
ncbi:CLUMA_CG009233, isoform A [Clunio marinus]|uniref:CLUMA_CG009233, isoform A n=1 Tax=Clunio marinus TaxID=568069 RepID=A0A1J1I681_9DIPT|nr:CLUMA_CG009233, isoform A [Clunio marinus]